MRFLFIKLCILTSFILSVNAGNFSEEFFLVTDTNTRKEEFIKIMVPLIENANAKVLNERQKIEDFFENVKKDGFENSDKKDLETIKIIAKKYKIDDIEDEEHFKLKVAPIPLSLALTQAALESGWGTSRFVKEANNIFGQWTWTQKNGLVPNGREDGKTHRLRVFNSLQDSVNAYILNLNTHHAYKDFRETRMESDNFNGIEAAETMLNYSELKEEYVKLLKNMIKSNKFLKYDEEDEKKAS